MNFVPLAVEKLEKYEAMKQAVENIPEEIETLKYEIALDGEKRSAPYAEDVKMLKALELSLANAKAHVESVDRAMGSLLQHEKLILYRMLIEREKNAYFILCEDLEIEPSAVYKRRKKALINFTRALYGCADTKELL